MTKPRALRIAKRVRLLGHEAAARRDAGDGSWYVSIPCRGSEASGIAAEVRPLVQGRTLVTEFPIVAFPNLREVVIG